MLPNHCNEIHTEFAHQPYSIPLRGIVRVQRFTDPISLTKASRCETDWRSRWWRRVTYHTSSYQTRRADPQETASNVSQTAEICHTHMHISQMSTVTHFTWLCHRQLRGVPGYLLTNSDIRQNGKIYLPIGSFSRKSLCLCDPLCDIYINPRRQYGQFKICILLGMVYRNLCSL